MADRVFIIPLRSDLAGVGLNLGDLHPNAGQKNSIYEGTHQNVYVAESLDPIGATVVNGIAYMSGSLNTLVEAAHEDADDQVLIVSGANDCTATQQTAFGLAAYLLDRVQALGAGGDPLTAAEAMLCAQAIMNAADAGDALTLVAINALLVANVGANTELTAAGGSDSFGTVLEILRILSGETYRLPVGTVLGDVAGGAGFWPLVTRTALVGTAVLADVAALGQFYTSGGFLTATDAGYRARPTLVPGTSFNISNAAGVINGYKQNITLLRREFAYNAADVTPWRPRAMILDIVAAAQQPVPATGIYPAIGVYDQDGNAL